VSTDQTTEERVMLNARIPKSLRQRLRLAKIQLEEDQERIVLAAIDEYLRTRGL
jgi:hypothetical protein